MTPVRDTGRACHNPPNGRHRGRLCPAEDPAIDIIFLVERLESEIANGRALPLTKNVIIDRDIALNLIDELRVAVPEEVRAAKRINSEGERIIEKAQEEAERIIARAQEQAAFLIEDRGLTLAADEESRRIVAMAEEEAAAVRRGADEYAGEILAGLEADVTRTLRSIERGIALLEERRAALAAGEPPPPDAEGAADVDDQPDVDEVDEEEGASPNRSR